MNNMGRAIYSVVKDAANEMDMDMNMGKFKNQYGDNVDDKRLREESPTNTNMRASFILQNSNISFDRYFAEMRKRAGKGSLTSRF